MHLLRADERLRTATCASRGFVVLALLAAVVFPRPAGATVYELEQDGQSYKGTLVANGKLFVTCQGVKLTVSGTPTPTKYNGCVPGKTPPPPTPHVAAAPPPPYLVASRRTPRAIFGTWFGRRGDRDTTPPAPPRATASSVPVAVHQVSAVGAPASPRVKLFTAQTLPGSSAFVFAAGPIAVRLRALSGDLLPIAPDVVETLRAQVTEFATPVVLARTFGALDGVPVVVMPSGRDEVLGSLCSSPDRLVYALSNEWLTYSITAHGRLATLHADVYSRDCRNGGFVLVTGLDETTSAPGTSWTAAEMIDTGHVLQAKMRDEYLSLLTT